MSVLRLPIIAAIIVFVVAIASTQVALRLENRESDKQTQRLAQVYLDGLEAATRDAAMLGDWEQVRMRFNAAFRAQEGVTEVILRLVGRDGAALVEVDQGRRPQVPAVPAAFRDPAAHLSRRCRSGPGLGGAAAVGDDATMFLVAALDIDDLLAARRNLFCRSP